MAHYPGKLVCNFPPFPWLLSVYFIPAAETTSADGGVKFSVALSAGKNESHPQVLAAVASAGAMRSLHALISVCDGRTMYMPLIADDPPSS